MKTNSFSSRHIGPRAGEVQQMLQRIGVKDVEQLLYETFPDNIRLEKELELEPAMSEYEYLNYATQLGQKNKVFRSLIGMGYHEAVVPSVILRNIFENPGWYTAYTPYQAEIAQGRLEALLNFQTVVIELTGMEIANASLLDESTAVAEAMALLFDVRTRDQKKNNANKFFVSEEVLPQTLSVLQTRAIPIGVELVVGNHQEFKFEEDYFGAILQYPGKYGQVHDYEDFIHHAHSKDIKVALAADILSLARIKSPGELGADVAVGTTQRFGIPLGFGGPHAAYFATKEEYKRSMPGRIIGVSKDANGKEALRMALQTREQHIKREKATSNICTAQVLLAVMAGFYAVYHGPEGLKYITSKIHRSAVSLEDALKGLGYKQLNTQYFDTLLLEADAESIRPIALSREINFYYPDANHVAISLNESTTLADLNDIVAVFAEAAAKEAPLLEALSEEVRIPESVARKSEFMTHEVFNTFHSETEMMRYIKRLERKDLALNHSMIPLGSCTMKLNAAAEMLPISYPQWGNIHPFVPLDQAEGYQIVLKKLAEQLSRITGMADTSLQPNSGAQGEYAGLLAIRAYHQSRGESHRNICLIPSSAHGTNPASAVMAGMKVVVTKSSEEGNIDVDDLRDKAEKYKDNLAALMVTYPSTHGVYESAIREVTKIIHDNGGQVYMDGANMNAQVGLTNPGVIGADVCHLNLHKTFAIPHGGGGPGVGPIGVAAHLVDFLPGHPVIDNRRPATLTVSAAPWGSAGVLPITYGYIKILGAKGLTLASKIAILNANYLAAELEEDYGVLYRGEQGRVAHELILECRHLKAASGVSELDIAKRLMDYGFHAPTLSFPVHGTLMIEPTESESKAELDRFVAAMRSIRREICELEEGVADREDNVLKNAPHTQEEVVADSWKHPYGREKAAYPLEWVRENKFWLNVGRVDRKSV